MMIVCTPRVLFWKQSFTSHTYTHKTHGLKQQLTKFACEDMSEDMAKVM